MQPHHTVRYVIASAVVFVTGLMLGAGKSSDDTSPANTASKILLAIGLIALIVTGVFWLVSRRRSRRGA